MSSEAKAQNRYRVLERLESGGMAEVFRGEAESLAGFKKPVAIKRVLPHLAQNERFIRMFLDEARLCARLSHANVVQVFDIGHVENTYFIVMEFVEGANLKALMEHVRKSDRLVPLGVAVYIAMEVCKGLQYAHDLTDGEGIPLRIVHRDVSPPNVLLSRQGEVKLVDFGLAKAAMQVEKTDPGVVKGKFSYLAPETALGKEAGPQADVFAVGIILWEMLAGRRLFLGSSDFQTVTMVQKAEVPSIRSINRDVPEEIERVLARALARDTNARFMTAQDFAEALADAVTSLRVAVSGFDVARLVRETIETKRAVQSTEPKSDASIDKLITDELTAFRSLDSGQEPTTEPQAAPIDPGTTGAQPLDAGLFDFGGMGGGKSGLGSLHTESVAGRRIPAISETAALDLARMLEGDDPARTSDPSNASGGLPGAPLAVTLPTTSSPDIARDSKPPREPMSPLARNLIIAILLVASVAGVLSAVHAFNKYRFGSTTTEEAQPQ